MYNKYMESKLIQIRIKSTLVSIASYLGSGILIFLLSPETVNSILGIVGDNFGNSAILSLLVLIVPEVAKDLRNRYQLKKLGGIEDVILI